jgi:hypothetical protein
MEASKEDLGNIIELMKKGNTVHQAVGELKLEGSPAFYRQKLVERYGAKHVREIVKKYVAPHMTQKVKGFAEKAVKVVANVDKGIVANIKIQRKRLRICRACDRNEFGDCMECGCPVRNLVRAREDNCEYGKRKNGKGESKWSKINTNNS